MVPHTIAVPAYDGRLEGRPGTSRWGFAHLLRQATASSASSCPNSGGPDINMRYSDSMVPGRVESVSLACIQYHRLSSLSTYRISPISSTNLA